MQPFRKIICLTRTNTRNIAQNIFQMAIQSPAPTWQNPLKLARDVLMNPKLFYNRILLSANNLLYCYHASIGVY